MRVKSTLISVCLVTLAMAAFGCVSSAEASGSAWKALTCGWTEGFSISGLDGEVSSIATRDTATGLEIFAGGWIPTADGQIVNHVARWAGDSWSALEGPNGTGLGGPIYAMAMFDSGGGPELYVGGQFDTAGGVAAYGIARWTGSGWATVGDPPGLGEGFHWIEALTVFDDGDGPALYAAGFFGEVGGHEANGIAKWDGARWSAVGEGVYGIRSLVGGDIGSGPTLFAGASERVMQFDGSAWSQLGSFPNAGSRSTNAMVIWDDGTGRSLYTAGQKDAPLGYGSVSRWTGTDWVDFADLGGPFGSEVNALETLELNGTEMLVAGGTFREIGGEVETKYAAAWDGNSWQPLDSSGQGPNKAISALAKITDVGESVLLIGGIFNFAGNQPASGIARWDGLSWSGLPSTVADGNGFDDAVYQYITWDDGHGEALYAAGNFELAGGLRVNNIARWNGEAWEPLAGPSGTGTEGWIDALAVFDDGTGSALYVGGYFETAGGVLVNNVARWDGTSWSALTGPLGTGVSNAVRELTVWDDGTGSALFVGGKFLEAGGVSARKIAKWDGAVWSGLDQPNGPSFGVVLTMEPFDDGRGPALFVSGYFGGKSSDGNWSLESTAKWDGQSWIHTFRGNLPSWIETMEVWDDGTGPALYGAGDGGDLTRWNGVYWEMVSDGVYQWIRSLAVWDDGTGPKLYAAGWGLFWFPGVDNTYIASWDGTRWSGLSEFEGSEPDDTVATLYGWDHGGGSSLLLGGEFSTTAGIPSAHHAEWSCHSSCEADPDHLLCLGEDRFVIDISWRDFEGHTGSGHVVPFQTDRSGLFYFFGENNWEVLIKVLDGCSINNNFWVFSAASTSVEYTLTVTDTATGISKSYFNPLGVAAPAVTDTSAFPTCTSGTESLAAPPTVSGTTSKIISIPPSAVKPGCTASDTALCLRDTRFRVEIDWRDFEGNTGPGKVIADTPADGSGLFQFFGPNNWEVLVKVLDGCNSNDRYWVFAAATTNVEYTMRVTDTETGETHEYFNPLGVSSSAVTDTNAFATCP